MKSKIITITFLVLVFFSLLRLINRPVTDNDEGVYWTTFLLVNKGHPLYKETFFSQPLGFFWTTYPGFLFFGKTIQAARLTVLVWGVIGLIGLISLMEGQRILSLFVLLSIPSFYQQVVTLQSDGLVVIFSTLALVSMYRYIESLRLKWVVLSGIFFALAFWTKFEVSIVIPLFLLLFINKKQLTSYLLFIASFVLISLIFVIPFGSKAIINNIFMLRIQSLSAYSFESLKVFNLLKTDLVLLSIIIISLVLSIFLKSKVDSLISIFLIWSIISFCLLFLYRPLFVHHLIFLTIPFALTFSLLIAKYKRLNRIALVFFVCLALFNNIRGLMKTDKPFLTNEQKIGIELIKKYTQPNDLVVSDEGVLNAASGRLPPPELVDVSFVRIKSGNLSPERFKANIYQYRPKLIIAWNGRLKSMKDFEKIVEKDYKILKRINSKVIYYR